MDNQPKEGINTQDSDYERQDSEWQDLTEESFYTPNEQEHTDENINKFPRPYGRGIYRLKSVSGCSPEITTT